MLEHNSLQQLGSRIRRRVLDTAYVAKKGHIGSALSVCEVIAAVALEARDFGSGEINRDRIVLSKGHAALALYCALVELGALDESELNQYCHDASLLQTHPDAALRGIDFSTGSLGMGLGFGVGTALAARLQNSDVRTFVIVSDSELNEGSTWESVALAGTLALSQLTVILDYNGQQALGFTKDVLRVGNPAIMWESMGFEVLEVDGHDVESLRNAIGAQRNDRTQPRLVIARTTAGHGVSFMESRIKWHYLPMTKEQYDRAILEWEKSCERG